MTAPGHWERRLPVGAEVAAEDAVHFRVWAPRRSRVEVAVDSGPVHAIHAEEFGYFSGLVPEIRPGSRYRFRLDGGDTFPDPASRFQPEGPHGPSMVVDPKAFRWTDTGWRGVSLRGQVIYEMHVGTFTSEGTWAAAIAHLPALADLGVTLLEVMPVAEFSGQFGWGYDGVDLFAPTHLYGTPDDFRRFVDRAHSLELGVILDVVYNHLGPDGNYLREYSPHYFSRSHVTEWGDGLNFDGDHAAPVREFVTANAGYWIDEFHLDGLRLDATQTIADDSGSHILSEIADRARAAAGGRSTVIVGENEPQDSRLIRPREHGGLGLDALWNDDFHHSAIVALTGRDEAYYTDYRGRPQELLSAIKYGFLYQGQWYRWQQHRRGTASLDIPPARLIVFLENHDQLANSARGERLHERASPSRLRAMTALLLLAPQTPMLFQGQEFASSAPFLYFADQPPEVAPLVKKGRGEFLAQFPSLALPDVQARLPDPGARETFERCKLDHAERDRHENVYRLHRDLLRLRREDPSIRAQRPRGVDGAVLADSAFVIRYFAEDGQDRLLVVNLGAAVHFDPAPEPLLAPPTGMRWMVHWTSDDVRYGGSGTPELDAADLEPSIPNWRIPAECTVLLIPTAIGRESERR